MKRLCLYVLAVFLAGIVAGAGLMTAAFLAEGWSSSHLVSGCLLFVGSGVVVSRCLQVLQKIC